MLSWERVYEIDIIYSSTDILPQIEKRNYKCGTQTEVRFGGSNIWV